MSRLLVIGIGQPHRGDDAAGLIAAQALREHAIPSVTVREIWGDMTSAIPILDGATAAWIIDAVVTSGKPGAVVRLDMNRDRIPADLSTRSTHGISILHAVELARGTVRLPKTLIFHGITTNSFQVGTLPSRSVQDAIEQTTRSVLEEVISFTRRPRE